MDVDIDEFSDVIEATLFDARNLASKSELELQVRVAVKAFKNSDTDGNNVVTHDEMARLCDIMGLPLESDEQDLLIQTDTDGSGSLDLMEWITWWLKRSSTLPNPAKQQEVIARNTFQKYDEDRSGCIDMDELTKLLEDIGGNFTTKELSDAMNELDKDGNHILDENEFVDWWCNRCIAGRKNASSLISLKLKRLAKKASRIFYTDIHTAAWQGDSKLVSSFLQSDSRLANASDSTEYGGNWTVLHYACYKGHLEVVEVLLENRANVNSTNNEGFTPLFYAAQQGYVQICELMLERGADPTICGVTAAADNHYYPGVIMSPLEHMTDTPALKSLFEESAKCQSNKLVLSTPIRVSDINTTLTIGGMLTITGLPEVSSISRDLFVKYWRVKLCWGDDVDSSVFDIRIKHIPGEEQVIELKEVIPNYSTSKWVDSAMIRRLYCQIQVVTPLNTTSPWSTPIDIAAPVAQPKARAIPTDKLLEQEMKNNDELLDEYGDYDEDEVTAAAMEALDAMDAKATVEPVHDSEADVAKAVQPLGRQNSKGNVTQAAVNVVPLPVMESDGKPTIAPVKPTVKPKHDIYADRKPDFSGENPYPFGSAAYIKFGKQKAASESGAKESKK